MRQSFGLFSMTFHDFLGLQIWILNSMTFHDLYTPCTAIPTDSQQKTIKILGGGLDSLSVF